MAAGHVPMEVFGLQVQAEDIGQERPQDIGDLGHSFLG
jgi:hypothetical protein